ncbi:ABC transporter substrate-binding protein [Burkholderia sp. LA-2-3-30-S1-D2]|uniref:ABC transporter substrate-binding protein n=1 Tax=Burkholderia sp. LA-2-3-30-S1-D2 TaxID=1637862 RepID=UPI00075E1C5F|nr:ABC transporter substrate-binding protein [Burkholderia sp. LA-2-3-30-S1-D2]AOI95505.1 amino acid ABC transporter substrate-binding protein [Burkholderia sp. LA-2-3-30-S1-D2]KVE11430.1 amino acid ABC transporter substrate-binding protein [Burkholderia sp. LA-2-3-30-S1-D2]
MNLYSGCAMRALPAWFREIVPEGRCLHRLLRGAACALVTVSCAAPALALDASAPAATATPATTSTGLVQMPDGRLLAPEFARIVTRGTLVVAVLGVDQPPFFMSRNGALAGVDIDLADELAKKLGVSVQFDRDARTFDDVVQLIATGQADVAISKLSRTLPRAQMVRFSTPYINLRRALLINRVSFAELAKGRPLPEVVRDYRGTIGVVAGSAYAEYVRTDFPAARVRTYPSWPATLDALNTGAVTAVYRDELAIKLVMQDDPTAPIRLRVATFDDLTDALAVGVPVSTPTLLAFVNQFLAERSRRLDVKSLLDAMGR